MAKSPLTSMQMGKPFGITQTIEYTETTVWVFCRLLQRYERAFKEVPGDFPKSDLLGVTVALIHVAAQRFL